MDRASRLGVPILQIFHVEEEGPFSPSSGHVVTLEPLRIAPSAIFRKTRHSALIASGLDVWLNQNGIRRIIISGIRTEQCCETTARHASDLGYSVDFAADATLTFAMTGSEGRRWSANEIKARTKLVLADRFARLVDVSQAMSSMETKIG